MAGKAELRAPGWYFIRRARVVCGDELVPEGWRPAEWSGVAWFVDGLRYGLQNPTSWEIDERPIERSPVAPAGEVEATADDIEWFALFVDMEAASDERFSFSADDIERLKRILAAAATRAAQERRAGAEEMREVAARLAGELDEAVSIIRKHVPIDALGYNADGDLEESHLTRSWPILAEHLHYMDEALQSARDAGLIPIRALPIPGEEEKA